MPALDECGRRSAKLRRVDRLMKEAEEARPKSVSPGRTPEAFLHGDRSRREDWASAGELWLRGERARAIESANAQRKRQLRDDQPKEDAPPPEGLIRWRRRREGPG
jgi:hypothetical protein